MKILVTGGYGFIGSFVAEKFANEGHEVIIIDNLVSGNVKNCSFRHISYIADVESPVCETIFQNHKVDVIVHLAAQVNVVTSMENPYADTKSNILGLTNILQLAAKYKISKLVFASSAAVYGLNENTPLSEDVPCQPVSPYGINKLLGEYYCEKWSEIYQLNTLCFRFANVYGPRQGSIGEGGVISIFMERLRDGKELFVYGTGEQTRDFIYVEDVADAIYRACQSNASGVMNLSTNTESSVNQLIDILSGLQPIASVTYTAPRLGDIDRSTLDNSLVKTSLNWEPRFNLTDGLDRTYAWFAKATPVPQKGHDSAKETSLLDEASIQNDLINSSLSRNIRSLYLSQGTNYLEGVPVLKPDVFHAVIRSREHAKQKFNTAFSLLSLDSQIMKSPSQLENANNLLRDSDYIGLTEDGRLFILLSNATVSDAVIVVERLHLNGVPAQVLTEEDRYYAKLVHEYAFR